MSRLVLLRGGSVLTEGRLQPSDVLLENGKIAMVGPDIAAEQAEPNDVSGLVIAPGFIDVHVHGGGGFSLLSTDPGEISQYSRWVASRGVTSFLATICATDVAQAVQFAEAAVSARCDGAEMLGVNYEGPFVSPGRRGALPESWPSPPDASVLGQLMAAAPVRVMTIAPERDGGMDLIAAAGNRGVRVSIGHTDATYEVALRAFGVGASHVTHAFNAMRPMHHREPGPIGAVLEADGVTVEAVADGVHLHPATVRLLVKALGADRVCLVTDAVSPAGMNSGVFRIGSEDARLADGRITLPDGTIAGSAATMDAVVRNVTQWGLVDLASALHMASGTPALAAGVGDRKGRIAAGYDADLVLLSEDLAVRETWVGGRRVYTC
jgi:N-acetylglucosamine-6-phosphate deacetylase